ncbi:MAG: bifunctional riboflavin kinase/FAD synthetase [Ruminococcaceae bacterium]|nr:bifunctional riboflavin kinase/FAD synthetase [Oscillospiraceae bacterium]
MGNHVEGAFVALGTFDGLHIGHKAVITAEKTEYQRKIVLMFNEHPLVRLKGENPGELITREKTKTILDAWGVSPEYIDFSEICDLSPETFVDEILVKRYNAKSLACGFNYRFGKNASADAKELMKLCAEREIKITVVDAVNFENESVSSSRIRKAIANGDMKAVKGMLGRYFSYDFPVAHGDERGRKLGLPTINQFFTDDFAVPEYGVYASITKVNGEMYPSVTNIGVRPTIGNSEKRSETNIIGFDGDIYGQCPEVFLVEKIRNEMKFASLDELKQQISKDREYALSILKGVSVNEF